MSQNDLEYISRILKNNEGDKLEVKLSADGFKDNVAKALCGLANHRGGKVIIGLAELKFYKPEMGDYDLEDIINNEYIIYGVNNTDRVRLDLSSHLRANTNLGVSVDKLYSVLELVINDKKVIILKVKPLFLENNFLTTYKEIVYRRMDNQTVKLTTIDVIQLFSGKSVDKGSIPKTDEKLDNDSMLEDATRVVIENRKASTSLLQRRLRIGYGRASRLIDALEEAGVISPMIDGSKPREVLIQDLPKTDEKLDNDSMLEDATRVVIENRKASTSLLQRRLKIGYGRASRLIDTLEEVGIIAKPEGSKPRDVLVKDFFTAMEIVRKQESR